MDERIIKALRRVLERIGREKIRWVIVGSTSLALQGVDIEPRDIDILTDKEGAIRLSLLLEDFNSSIKIPKSEIFRSDLKVFEIHGVEVDVMRDLEERTRNGWRSLTPRLVSPKIVKIDGMDVPVSSLEEQLESYEIRGRDKDTLRIKKIKEALTR